MICFLSIKLNTQKKLYLELFIKYAKPPAIFFSFVLFYFLLYFISAMRIMSRHVMITKHIKLPYFFFLT